MTNEWHKTIIDEAAYFTKKPRGLDCSTFARIPFIPMELVPQGNTYILEHILKPGREIKSGNYFEKGDCLISKITPCFENGKQGIVRELSADFGYASTELIPFRGIKGISNKYYLYYFFLEATTRRQIAQKMEGATGRQRIPMSVLKSWPIFLPPLPEQKKIAAVLLKIQQAIEIQEKIIQSLHDLKKSTMQHLFTHGLRGEKTKMTEIGEIPWSWRESKLGSLCKSNNGCIQTGPFGSQLHVSDYQLLGVPVVNPTHMFENRIIHDRIPYVSEANANRLSRHILETGDILFARRGEIGRHALVAEYESAWLCGTGCFLIRIRDSRVSAAFISWLLYSKSSQDWLKAHAAGAIMPNLNNKILQTCPVTFPKTRTEQSEIVNCLDGLVQKLDFHESKKSAFQDLFKATLNKLMTGAISTKDLHINTAEVSV